jgi:hypothetical protein
MPICKCIKQENDELTILYRNIHKVTEPQYRIGHCIFHPSDEVKFDNKKTRVITASTFPHFIQVLLGKQMRP